MPALTYSFPKISCLGLLLSVKSYQHWYPALVFSCFVNLSDLYKAHILNSPSIKERESHLSKDPGNK